MTHDTTHDVVVLAGAQTVRQAAQTHADISAALAGPGALRLDVAGVSEADLSVIQIILAAHRSAAARDRRLELCAPPAGALRDALQRGGFAQCDATDPARWISHEVSP
jgi:ABC-type transporter Mla MlaB component